MESLDDSEDNRAATALAASLACCDSCTGFTEGLGPRKLGGDCGESLAVGVDMGVENSSELSKELRLL